jgi:hypothetical protein
MPRARVARIAFARISTASLTPQGRNPAATALEQSMVAGTLVERYGRQWRIGQTQRVGSHIVGRIGFQGQGPTTELWDDSLADFRREVLTEGHSTPFAVRRSDLRTAFQLRPGIIERTTFCSNLQALLNAAQNAYKWRVEPERTAVSWPDWLARVDRITQLRVKVVRPNPHYEQDEIEALLEQARANAATIALKAQEQGLSLTDSELIAQALDHAEAGYGEWTAEGEFTTPDGVTEKEAWKSREVAPEQRVEADPETGEASTQALRQQLDEPSNADERDDR